MKYRCMVIHALEAKDGPGDSRATGMASDGHEDVRRIHKLEAHLHEAKMEINESRDGAAKVRHASNHS